MATARNSLLCPRCSAAVLETRGYEGVEIDICVKCRGLWCEASDWNEALLGPRPADSPLQSVPEVYPESHPVAPDAEPTPVLLASGRADCPSCRVPLAPIGVKGVRGLQIDLCESCRGIWLDNGEWQYLEALRSWTLQRPRIERDTTWGEWAFQFILRLPIEFNIAPRRKPVVTLAIVLVCTLVQLAYSLGIVTDEQMLAFAVPGRSALQLETWYTLITYQFLHAGWLHLLGNLYLLYILGDNVEDVMGPFRYLVFYLICGIVAAVTQVIVAPDLPLVGASGSIAGVIAAYLVLFRRARLTFMFFVWQLKPPAFVWIGIWILLNVAAFMLVDNDIMEQIAWMAHVGGFVAGLALTLPFRSALVESSPLLYLLDRRQIEV